MRKIRRFKIPVHHREIARRIANAGVGPQAGLSGEAAAAEFVSVLACELEPSVVYDTFGRDAPFAEHAGVFSAAAVTLGRKIDEKISSLSDPSAKEAAAIASLEFLETAADFVRELIEDEAKKENFETHPPEALFLPAQTASGRGLPPRFARLCDGAGEKTPLILQKLSADKIGVEPAGSPAFTFVFLLPWAGKKKRRAK